MDINTKYYIDSNNKYIGGFAGSEAPPGAIEVPLPPDNAHQEWNGSGWLSYVSVPSDIHVAWFRSALAEIDKLEAVNAAVQSMGAAQTQVWEYASTINKDDTDVINIARALGIDLDALMIRAAKIRDARNGS
jgi:hypothetical protein